MPQVKSKVTIRAPFATVWKIAQDVERFPSIMPDLDSVKILEETQTSPDSKRTVTQWAARIKQFNRSIVWTEEDTWNTSEGACHFWQIKGDFTEYKGVWKFRDNGNNTTEMDLVVDYAFDIPLVGALLKSVMQKLMQQNVDMMTNSLQSEAQRLENAAKN